MLVVQYAIVVPYVDGGVPNAIEEMRAECYGDACRRGADSSAMLPFHSTTNPELPMRRMIVLYSEW